MQHSVFDEGGHRDAQREEGDSEAAFKEEEKRDG